MARKRAAKPKSEEKEVPVRKNFRLHQSKLDAAREVLGTKTDTETIEVALALVTLGKRLAEGTRRLLGWEWQDPFMPDD